MKLPLATIAIALLSVAATLVPSRDGASLAEDVVAIETLPYVIERPGRYRLAKPLISPIDTVGVRILVSDVELDLGGFRFKGAPGSRQGVLGVEGIERVEISNGIVVDWGHDGIDLSGCTGARLRDVELRNNAGHGAVLGPEAHVVDVHTQLNNGGAGLVAAERATLRRVTAVENEYGGLHAGPRSTLEDCSATRTFYGVALAAGTESTLRRCRAFRNDSAGIEAGPGSLLALCTAERNVDFGIAVGQRSLALGCEVRGTLDGPALLLHEGATADGCTVAENAADGLVARTASVVRDCALLQNRGAGLRAESAAAVLDNRCEAGGDGMLVSGAGTIVRGNEVGGNRNGRLAVDGARHLVFANRARELVATVDASSRVAPVVGPDEESDDPLANRTLAE